MTVQLTHVSILNAFDSLYKPVVNSFIVFVLNHLDTLFYFALFKYNIETCLQTSKLMGKKLKNSTALFLYIEHQCGSMHILLLAQILLIQITLAKTLTPYTCTCSMFIYSVNRLEVSIKVHCFSLWIPNCGLSLLFPLPHSHPVLNSFKFWHLSMYKATTEMDKPNFPNGPANLFQSRCKVYKLWKKEESKT